jgi:hypothetical protein
VDLAAGGDATATQLPRLLGRVLGLVGLRPVAPAASAPARSDHAVRRQFHRLTDAEVADLADAVVHAMVTELRRRDVAGADRADGWELADELRRAILDHHAAAFRRALAQALEARRE